MGYKPVYSQAIFDRDFYFAGTVERRRQELEDLLRQPDIAALICVRGGYGSNYLLESFHFELFAHYPKIFLGCSDITSSVNRHYGPHRPGHVSRSNGRQGHCRRHI